MGKSNMQSTSRDRILRENPKSKASFCSTLFFGYTLQTFRRGWRHGIAEEDLYVIPPDLQSQRLGDELERTWEAEVRDRRRPSLFRALRRIHLRYFLRAWAVLTLMQMAKIAQAVSLYYFLVNVGSAGDNGVAYVFATFVVLPSFAVIVGMHGYMLSMQELGARARIACCSLLHRKCLRLGRAALENTTVGQMVNLLSNDVARFDIACLHLPYLLEIPVELSVTLALLYHFGDGCTPFAGVVFFLIIIPLQILLGKRFAKVRHETALRTDERVRLMNEIVSGIQVIKMHTWEESFAKLVQQSRKVEMRAIYSACNIKSMLLSFAIITNRVAVFLALLAFVLTGHALRPDYVFLIVAIFGVMRVSMTIALPNAISQVADSRVSIGRLEHFLLYQEVATPPPASTADEVVHIRLRHVFARWPKGEHVLTDITFDMDAGDMLAVIGMVGSGKTSLLNVLLREIPIEPTKGSQLEVVGELSYAAQEPWLFVGTVRQNILFGAAYEQTRYNQVLTVCALKRDLSVLPFGDETVIGERGVSLSGGQRARINLARAVYRQADIYLLDDPLAAVDTTVGGIIFEECIKQFLAGKCVVLVTHQMQFLQAMPMILMLQAGRIAFVGGYRDMAVARPELVVRLEEKVGADDLATAGKKEQVADPWADAFVADSRLLMQTPRETLARGAVKRRVYIAYINAGGNMLVIFLLVVLFVSTQFLASGCDYFIKVWLMDEQIRADGDSTGRSTENHVMIYSLIVSLMIFVTVVRSISFFAFCMRASVRLHAAMFHAVTHAPMAFFNKQPSGRILNRFAKDMGTIDDQFPFIALDTLQIALSLCGVICVTVLVNVFTIIPIAVLLVLFYMLRVYYLRTSRMIKRLEGITRSPVFTQLNATLGGLSTIRALRATALAQHGFERCQDVHSSAWDMLLSTSRAFGLALDLLCCVYICLVTFGYLLIFAEAHSADVGLAITQSLMLTGMLQWGMRQWSELENCMTSVERVYEYTRIEAEQPAKASPAVPPPPPYWPAAGAIEFRHVYLKYGDSEPYVLRDLSFKVKPAQKIGIVGRTGAGKSSIIASLFQLAATEGQIIIDEMDVQTIPLQQLRSKIAIIPQEPVLFAGTLRKNLDPFEEHSDTLLWKALEEVALLAAVARLPLGLSAPIAEGGANFSVGQRQLLCLARAIVRSNRILVLDEATANVDPETDGLIQSTIREKFRFCTVLTIAHRLHTILDADKVLVMEQGRAMEYGYSYVLLQNSDGIFYSLVHNAGERMREEIMRIAEENYFNRKHKGVANAPKPLESDDMLLETYNQEDSASSDNTRPVFDRSVIDNDSGSSDN